MESRELSICGQQVAGEARELVVRSDMAWRRAIACLAVVLTLTVTGCQARITDAIVTKEDRALFPIASAFGFGEDGHIDITLRDFQPWHHSGEGVPDPNLARMGFFLTTSEAQTLLEFDLSQVQRAPPPLLTNAPARRLLTSAVCPCRSIKTDLPKSAVLRLLELLPAGPAVRREHAPWVRRT